MSEGIWSGNSNDGRTKGDIVWNTSGGRYGGAFEFDGAKGYVYLGLSIPDMTSLTIGAWVKYKGSGTRGYFGETIFTDLTGVGANDLVFATNGTHVHIRADKSGESLSDYADLGQDITGDSWRHLVWTMTSSESKVYLDGELADTVADGGSNVGYHGWTAIGAYYQTSGNSVDYFNGTIDEVRIWNRSLSAAEVNQMYMSNLNKYDSDKWLLYVNQSNDTNTGLVDDTYTYQVFASDIGGNDIATEERNVTFDTVYPTI